MIMNGMVELPKSGKAIVVTDIHGNLFILNKLMEKAIKELSFGNYFICCGDFLHSMGDKDKSIEIIEMLIYLKSRYPRNFIVLLGNHEWAHISGKPVYKGETNLKDGFIALLKEKYDTKWNEKYNQYKSFFKTLKIAARTGKTLISHAAPDKLVTEEDFSNYNPESVRGPEDPFYGMLWARPRELGYTQYAFAPYDLGDLDLFLQKMRCKLSIVGHTPVSKFQKLGSQLILNSMYGLYLELDLSRDYTIDTIEACIKGI